MVTYKLLVRQLSFAFLETHQRTTFHTTVATSTAASPSNDWEKLKQLIFDNDTFLESLSTKNLFLLVIGNDLRDVFKEEKTRDLHLLLALGHKQEKMAKRFPDTSTVDDELVSSLKASFRNGDQIDEAKSVLKIETGVVNLHLHLYSLFYPGSKEEYMSVSSKVFVSENKTFPESNFLSTHDVSGPVDNLAFTYSSSPNPSETETAESIDVFITELPEGICPDHIRTWTFKEGRTVEGNSS
ncbi:unnamed protein product [Colletotrichum noveboracense]|uniref:Uncharacterized protein n=1 Tax=Colletotrichum noveboracense TaxID=2664923 RepID=A0A9W4RII1_9PEZI|nr:unnamed protein product [Colletotrichum noveboracense]